MDRPCSTMPVRLACSATAATLCLLASVPSARAVTAALCVRSALNGSLHLRATGTCKAMEIQIGSFDGTTLQLSGINLQVVSGSGKTDGAVNGKGNLILGYNEPGVCSKSGPACQTSADCGGLTCFNVGAKTGSHNLVVGPNAYASYGGFVTGRENSLSGPYASAIGGVLNRASGDVASVIAGFGNTASGSNASVTGGQGNTASGEGSSVSGGVANTASGTEASISGGEGLTQPVITGWAAGSRVPSNVVVGDFESP